MDSIICPITLEPIKEFGIICTGNIYEYDAIHKWLLDHNRDPTTNEILLTNFIMKPGINHINVIKRIALNFKENMKLIFPHKNYFNDIKNVYDKLIEIEKNINYLDQNEWNKYNLMKCDRFLKEKNDAFFHVIKNEDIDCNDTIKRH